MSFEHGGRADKEGNTYENRFLARLFLQLINEEFQYIQVRRDLSRVFSAKKHSSQLISVFQ